MTLRALFQRRAGLVLSRRWLNTREWQEWAQHRPRMAHILVVAALSLTGLAVARHLLEQGFPPGVDTPTFLHLSWFAREVLRGAEGTVDPYWYGGFHPFTTYPPFSYILVGALAAIPGVGLVFVYKTVLLVAYIGIGLATYYLALQVGSTRPWSALAGFLAMMGYPVLVSAGLWGWFSSLVALPLAILALAMLERAYHGRRLRYAALGGAALGLAFLAHHMTAFGFALGLPPWFLYYWWREPAFRRRLSGIAALFGGVAAAVTVWWIWPWAMNLWEAGFQRETPGLWSFPLQRYLKAITDRGLIGYYAYPNYLGVSLIVMAIGGVVHAVLFPSRVTPYAVLLLLLGAFSLGERVNPLLRVRPWDGLDVARFQVYMVPIVAVVGVPFLASVGMGLMELIRTAKKPAWLPGVVVGVLVVVAVSQSVWDGVEASGKLFHPYRVTPGTQQALDWLGQAEHAGKVLGVGFWHWDDFLLPYYLRQAVVDGWHDEGARNWRTVRALRMMMWTGQVDVPAAHRLLGELGGRYIVIQSYFEGESPDKFRAALAEHPELFSRVADWGEVTVYERVPPG